MAKKIIIVDDSAAVLMVAGEALEGLASNGVEYQTFDNPEDVIEAVNGGLVYDLLITDINMPQMSGFDLTKALKQIPSVKPKPIIALTTENSPEMKMQGKKVGLVGWLTKPFTEDKLIMAVKRVLRIR